MQRNDAVKALEIYRRAGSQVLCSQISILLPGVCGDNFCLYMFPNSSPYFRRRNYQNFMKYVRVLTLHVEKGLLRSSRFGISLGKLSRMYLKSFFPQFLLSHLIIDDEAPCIIFTSHGRVCEGCSTSFNSSQGSGTKVLSVKQNKLGQRDLIKTPYICATICLLTKR